jgi:hypothetical protein
MTFASATARLCATPFPLRATSISVKRMPTPPRVLRLARQWPIRAVATAALLASACTPAPQMAMVDSATVDSIAKTAGADTASLQRPVPDVADAQPPVDTPVATSVDTPARSATETPAGVRVAAELDTTAAADSAEVLPPLPLIDGRSRRDSISLRAAIRAGAANPAWPVKGPPPRPGAILPNRRIVAFYGNPLSRRMGILGELDAPDMLAKLDTVVRQWQLADPATPVQPALHLVAMVAQADAGRDGKYRLKMADTLVERVISWAATRNALVFLDLQVGRSTIQAELPRFHKFLEMPNVHVGIDPEFSMKSGHKPGERVGTYDAADIDWVVDYLAKIVDEKQLPPKVLVVHRFTRPMVTRASEIELDPRVQIVMHMDGWGAPYLKFDSYRDYVQAEPVQFTGFKIFYTNDSKRGHAVLTPPEVLALEPPPVYIQYQ